MMISNSKKQLAKIIHENGGWRDWVNFVAQDKDGEVFGFGEKPVLGASRAVWAPAGHTGILCTSPTIRGWHQTILSRDEYFHLYPAPDADGWIEWNGGECPVEKGTLVDVIWRNGTERAGVKALHLGGAGYQFLVADGMVNDIIAYRLHKPEIAPAAQEPKPVPEPEAKPSIEQLAADYRDLKDFADRKQQEADDAKADAEVKLAELVAAGEALGLELSVSAPEPELVITDWRDLQIGDEMECIRPNVSPNKYRGRIGRLIGIDEHDSGTPYLVDFGECAKIWCHDVKFIRRPAKGDANA